jgi:hypothetical protein
MPSKFLFLCFLISLSHSAFSQQFLAWDKIEAKLSKVSKNTKALSHVRCFFENHENDKFLLKSSHSEEFFNRCYANPTIEVNDKRYFALIDYTVPSDQKRMYVIDRKSGEIQKMAVAHGRYKAGFFNIKMKENKNTIRDIKYFSNTINSMASSSGFFVAGQDFPASDFGRSLVIHGIEEDINDNSCVRDVVIHKHYLMTKSKAYMLSSGCPMVSPSMIDQVINLLKGESDEDMKLKSGGSLVFIYGPREASWETSTCPGKFRN